MINGKHVIARWTALKSERGSFESNWQDTATYVLPIKDDVTTKSTPGAIHGQQILDNTAIQANELLAGFLHGFLTNSAEKWFEFTTGDRKLDEDDDVREWLQECEDTVMLVLLNSNFQTEVHEMYLDLGCFGTAPMIIEEDDKLIVRFSSKPISQVCIDENYRGEVDTVIRECDMSVRDINDMFGPEALNQKMKDELKATPEKKYIVIHAVYPRAEAERIGQKPETMLPYISQYVVQEDQRTIREMGFSEFPWVTPRWSKLSGEKYGRSPGMIARPEAKMINKMAETMIKGAQKVVDPPLQLPYDGFVLPLNTKPGGLNYRMSGTGDRDEIKPIMNDARIDFGIQVMESVRKRIRDAFYQNELMLSNDNPQMTATEVNQRTEEKNRFLGPLLGRQQAEFLRPMIDRVFAIMLRRRMFSAPPAKVQGKNLDVRYSSAIAKVQREASAIAIARTVQDAAPFIAMDQTVADMFNGEEATRELARIRGAPQRIIRNRDEIDKIRQARAQAQEQQNKLANAQVSADINQKDATAKAKLQAV